MSEAFYNQKDQLLDDVREVIESAEQLASISSNDASEKTKEFKTRIAHKLKEVKIRLKDAEEAACDHARAAVKVTDEYIHDNPYKTAGIAAAVGFLLGLLVSRR